MASTARSVHCSPRNHANTHFLAPSFLIPQEAPTTGWTHTGTIGTVLTVINRSIIRIGELKRGSVLNSIRVDTDPLKRIMAVSEEPTRRWFHAGQKRIEGSDALSQVEHVRYRNSKDAV